MKRVAIITGGASGIGKACVFKFIELGYKVIYTDLNPIEIEDIFLKDIYYYKCDMSNIIEIKTVISEILKVHERVDVLVNNVGAHPPATPINKLNIENVQRLINLNLLSTLLMCSYTFKDLCKTKGSIINISSMVALTGQDLAVDYCMTKAGQLGITRSLAIEAARHGVRVNAVCPSNVLTTAMTNWLSTFNNPAIKFNEMSKVQKLGRMAEPKEIANIVAFLANAESSFITGQIIQADGGSSLDYPIVKVQSKL